MKLSISVPDSLWETALQVAESDKPSLIIQEALRYWCYHRVFCGVEFEESVSFT